MKEKIIDFSNGIFSYDQVRLTTEPERIEIELDPVSYTHLLALH